MSSATIKADEPDSGSNPDLISLYPPYLAAFNAHSWPEILKCLSPACHGTFRGKLLARGAEEMRPEYEKDFARGDKHDVAIKEIRQIQRVADVGAAEGEEEWKKGIRWGLRLVLYDPTMRRTVVVNYWYRVEGGKWMQCWHEILDSVTDKAE